MWFLAFEIWPYLMGALAIGIATGWFSGCNIRAAAPPPAAAEDTA